MSLGKAMIHARKQKSIARAAAIAGEQVTIHSAHILQMPVLVLNASYEPINICGARRALVLVLKGIARTEEEHGLILHAQRSRIPMPSVIRLLEYRRIPYQTRALSRKNILLRDRNTCQYCGESFAPADLTLDHVIPRSRGGNSTWESGGLLPLLQPAKGQPHTQRDRRHDPAARAASLLAAHQPPDHAYARPRRRPLAQVSVLLVAISSTGIKRARHHRSPLDSGSPASDFCSLG
jgi:5-methylcytosine-specific restriction endonuclease McrA